MKRCARERTFTHLSFEAETETMDPKRIPLFSLNDSSKSSIHKFQHSLIQQWPVISGLFLFYPKKTTDNFASTDVPYTVYSHTVWALAGTKKPAMLAAALIRLIKLKGHRKWLLLLPLPTHSFHFFLYKIINTRRSTIFWQLMISAKYLPFLPTSTF